MFITTNVSGKNKQNVYVKLVEGYRENGKVKMRVVKNFGRLDALKKEKGEDILERLKAQYKEESEAPKAARLATRLEQVSSVLSAEDMFTSKSTDPAPTLNYGHYALRAIWNDELNMDRKIKHLQKTKSRAKFDLNAAISFMTFLKVLDPHSVKYSFGDKDSFLGDPARDISLDNFYDTLTFLKQNKDELFKWINGKIDEKHGTERASLVFYDVTNAYFESALTDSEMEYKQADYDEHLLAMTQKYWGGQELPPELFDEDGKIIFENLPQELRDDVAKEKIKNLRMRGPSKEHRYDLPIVSIALVIDKNGFPIDFDVYAGNASEFKTMPKTIRNLKAKYNIDSAVVVADRGLNSVDNLSMLQDEKLGFLMAQKVTQLGSALEKKMLDLSAYHPVDPSNEDAGKYLKIPNWSKKGADGKTIQCTLVFTYNEKRKARDEAILKLWEAIVERKAAERVKLGPKKTGWGALAMTEENTEQLVLGVDKEVLNHKKKFCGFAAVVYCDNPANENKPEDDAVKNPGLTGQEIASSYHRLTGIEECFRIMKSNLGLRPMYVRNSDHIRGHITICVLALLMLRIMKDKLRKNSNDLTVDTICRELRNANVSATKTRKEELMFILTSRSFNARRNNEWKTTAEVKELMAAGACDIHHMPSIMEAVGLKPVPRFCNSKELARSLGTLFPTIADAIPELRISQL